jgi:hypothetical protein
LGWRVDKKSNLFANVNKEVGGGAEFCDHSCDPNCVFHELKPIQGELEADGDSFTVDIAPYVLLSTREIGPNEYLGVDYGDGAVVRGGPTVEEYHDFKENFGDLQHNTQKKEAKKIFSQDNYSLPQKELDKRHENGEFGFDCKCNFCDDLHRLVRRPRSKLFMCDDTRIDYEALRNIFGLPSNVNTRRHELAPQPPRSFRHALLSRYQDLLNWRAVYRSDLRARHAFLKESQGESRGKGRGRKPQGHKPRDEGGDKRDEGKK